MYTRILHLSNNRTLKQTTGGESIVSSFVGRKLASSLRRTRHSFRLITITIVVLAIALQSYFYGSLPRTPMRHRTSKSSTYSISRTLDSPSCIITVKVHPVFSATSATPCLRPGSIRSRGSPAMQTFVSTLLTLHSTIYLCICILLLQTDTQRALRPLDTR